MPIWPSLKGIFNEENHWEPHFEAVCPPFIVNCIITRLLMVRFSVNNFYKCKTNPPDDSNIVENCMECDLAVGF